MLLRLRGSQGQKRLRLLHVAEFQGLSGQKAGVEKSGNNVFSWPRKKKPLTDHTIKLHIIATFVHSYKYKFIYVSNKHFCEKVKESYCAASMNKLGKRLVILINYLLDLKVSTSYQIEPDLHL